MSDDRPIALVISAYSDRAREIGRQIVREGYGVKLSTDPMQALLHLEKTPPALIFLSRELLPTGGLMFLRVLRAHTSVKTVPAVGFGSAGALPPSILAEAKELGLLDEMPPRGARTVDVRRRSTARERAPQRTHADTGTIPALGPVARVETRGGKMRLAIQSASPDTIDVLCGRDQLVRGDTIRMVVEQDIREGEETRSLHLRILAQVAGVAQVRAGSRCSLSIAAANPPEQFDAFVRYMVSLRGPRPSVQALV